MEGAVVHHVEACFVAMEEGQLGRGGQLAECGRDISQVGAFRAGGHGAFEEGVFDSPGATHAPGSGGHFLDHAAFDLIDGVESLEVLNDIGFEGFTGLAGEDHTIGEETVTDCILGRTELAFRGFGAMGETPISL